jgi:leucyl aminopeptidase (aminopeptidase T)
MRTTLYWEQFAEVTVRQLVRAKPGDPFLIITDTSEDISLAEACLAAGIRAGADTQLMIKPRATEQKPQRLGPILAEAVQASKLILVFCSGIGRDPAMMDARAKGTRTLSTNVKGIEEYVIRAVLDIDVKAMIRNSELVKKLWEEAEEGRVTTSQGTDVSFELKPRIASVGDGALSKDGEDDFFPGAQVNIAVVEKTFNGTIVVDASDGLQGLIHNPYTLRVEKGVITAVEGGSEAEVVRSWLASCNDEKVYQHSHMSIGMNPQAGISGNLIEDERKLGALDFGWGFQYPALGGTTGYSPYHWDIMLAAPSIYLDGKPMTENGQLNPEMGFEDM